MLPVRRIQTSLLAFFVSVPALFGQYKLEQSVKIGKEQGFLSRDIRAIKKGRDGFMWIGTGEGLVRFDGMLIKYFKEGNDLEHSLFDNSVWSLQPAGDKLWIGTEQGISVLNMRDYTFRHYQLTDSGKQRGPLTRKHDQYIATLYQDKSGKIWVGSRHKGVFKYDDGENDNFRPYTFSRKEYPPLIPSLAGDNSILSFEESERNDSIIWAGTPAGLQEINKVTGKVRLLTFPQKNKDFQVAVNAFRRLYHHDDGLLYVGSWAAGVNVYDPGTNTFTPLPVKNPEGIKMLNNPISNLVRKNDHEIWITTSSGLAIYDSDARDIIWCKFNNAAANEFYAMSYIDEASRVWYSTINGLEYFDPAMQQFSKYSFRHLSRVDWAYAFHIIADKSGKQITVCPRMTDGIYHFDREKHTWTKSLFTKGESFKYENDLVRGFAQLPNGDYIISADRAVFLFSERTQRFTEIKEGLPVSRTRRGEVMVDKAGYVWLSDDSKGLIKWKPGEKKHRVYNNGLLSIDSTRFFNRLVHLYDDSRGNIWFQRIGGYGVYLADRDSLVSFVYDRDSTNSFPTVQGFAEDKKGRVWLIGDDGKIGYALSSEPARGVIYKMNIRDKGLQGSFQYITVDPKGEIWSYTPKDLVKINADDLSFTRYNFEYGVPDVDFFHFSFLPSGEMVFGGRNEITIANPSEFKRNKEIPVPYISELQVLNQPRAISMDASPLQLRYRQNFFSIGFSAQAYTMARAVRFRYRLKEFDDWTETTDRRFANYTNVPGGDYVFQLQVANNEGVWNEKILEVPIHIGTAWWLTWWFRVGVLLALGAIGWGFYQNRINAIRRKEKIKSQYERKLANVEMTALLAQMNPHFLFNSLNSIDSYIIKNESKKASEYLNNFARLMRLILQNSRSNYISLKDELETLDLYLQMEALRFKGKFEYEINVDKEIDINATVIPPMLIQPYVENAIWHGLMHKNNGTTGKVQILISKNENKLLCVIQDNGIGRTRAEEIKAQKSAKHKQSMGMRITQDRIEMINKLYDTNTSMKIMDLQDIEGNSEGTRIELVIPV
jgi:ligand-binding sensor domain-containing protein/two-component sensor histidine kinase